MEATWICTGVMRQTNSEKLLLELGWEALSKRKKWHKLIYVFNIGHRLSSVVCVPNLSAYSWLDAKRYNNISTYNFLYKIPFSLIYNHWYGLYYSFRNIKSLSIFKRRIKDKFGYKRPPTPYCCCVRRPSIWHTLLCPGMSQLSAHLFPFVSVDSPRCSTSETMAAIRNIIASTLHPFTLTFLDKETYIKILHFGSKDVS